MANHLLSITTHQDYHSKIIRDFLRANRLLKRDPHNTDRKINIHRFSEWEIDKLQKRFKYLAEDRLNNIVIFTSGLLNRDLGSRAQRKNVLEVADDDYLATACTIVIGSAEMPMHTREFPHVSKMYGIVHDAVFLRGELGLKRFLSADTAPESVIWYIQREFFPTAAPLSGQKRRYIQDGFPIPTPT